MNGELAVRFPLAIHRLLLIPNLKFMMTHCPLLDYLAKGVGFYTKNKAQHNETVGAPTFSEAVRLLDVFGAALSCI